MNSFWRPSFCEWRILVGIVQRIPRSLRVILCYWKTLKSPNYGILDISPEFFLTDLRVESPPLPHELSRPAIRTPTFCRFFQIANRFARIHSQKETYFWSTWPDSRESRLLSDSHSNSRDSRPILAAIHFLEGRFAKKGFFRSENRFAENILGDHQPPPPKASDEWGIFGGGGVVYELSAPKKRTKYTPPPKLHWRANCESIRANRPTKHMNLPWVPPHWCPHLNPRANPWNDLPLNKCRRQTDK